MKEKIPTQSLFFSSFFFPFFLHLLAVMMSFSIWCKNYRWCNKEGENGLVLVSASFSSKNGSIEALERTLCTTPVFPVRNREKGTALKNVFVFFLRI